MLSNTATPKYYGAFRDAVVDGRIPVCEEISMQMHRIDALIENPGIYYDEAAVEGFIAYCNCELTLTDGSDLKLLDTFKLWAEDVFGWYYFAEEKVYVPYPNGRGGRYVYKQRKKRLCNKQYLILPLHRKYTGGTFKPHLFSCNVLYYNPTGLRVFHAFSRFTFRGPAAIIKTIFLAAIPPRGYRREEGDGGAELHSEPERVRARRREAQCGSPRSAMLQGLRAAVDGLKAEEDPEAPVTERASGRSTTVNLGWYRG